MEFAVDWLAGCVDQFECVGSVAIHEPVAIRYSSVREQEHHLMSGLGLERDEVPEHVGILQHFVMNVTERVNMF
jgi:hypothetical protein